VSEPASIPRTGRHSALAAIVAVVVIALASIGMIKMFRSSESQAAVPASESPAAPGCAAPAAPTVPADPGNKPVTTTHLSISPIGPLRDGFAVSLYQTSPDGARAWFCWVDRASDWHPLQVPAAGEAFGAVSDGTSLALPDIGDEDDHWTMPLSSPDRVRLPRRSRCEPRATTRGSPTGRSGASFVRSARAASC
jgi:hypothetical protein